MGGQGVEGGDPVGGLDDGVAVTGERSGHDLAHVGVVLHHQHAPGERPVAVGVVHDGEGRAEISARSAARAQHNMIPT